MTAEIDIVGLAHGITVLWMVFARIGAAHVRVRL